jgi:dihydrofolate reductase
MQTALMRHDLVDEYRLWNHPLTLGSGSRLFRQASASRRSRRVESKATPTGGADPQLPAGFHATGAAPHVDEEVGS